MDLAGKKIVVTGAASGMAKESTRVLRKRGATVIGMDRNKPSNGLVDEFVAVDLMDSAAIDAAVASIDGEVHALCNIAGVPPTAPVVTVVTVNFIALRYLTEQMLNKLSDGASIVNMASLAGIGWPEHLGQVKRFIADANFENAEVLCNEMGIDKDRSYFLPRSWCASGPCKPGRMAATRDSSKFDQPRSRRDADTRRFPGDVG